MAIRRLISILLVTLVLTGCDTGLEDDVVTTPPPPPVLKSPQDLSDNENNAVSLTWEEVETGESYQVQVSTSSGFTDVDIQKNRVLQTHLDIRELELGVPYHWRVRSTNEMGVGDWSEEWTFVASKEARFPPRAFLKIPPDRSINQPTTIEFKWEEANNASSYHLQIALDTEFISTFASLEGLQTTNRFVYGLVKSYTYYWRVRAYNPAGFGPWSETRYVIIGGIEGEPE